MITRRTTSYRGGAVIDVEEYPTRHSGPAGSGRMKKKKATPEEMAAINHANKVRSCRGFLLEYFGSGDLFVTWTYAVPERPAGMKAACADFQKAIRKVKREYKQRGKDLYWIRNIEKGTRGAWHIHLVVNAIDGAADILRSAWRKGGIYIEMIRTGKFYDEDFMKLAEYLTKDENAVEKKKDGTPAKPRVNESSYSRSRNMKLPETKKKAMLRLPKEPKAKKGYYIARIHEGVNPFSGKRYRRYTMIKLNMRI